MKEVKLPPINHDINSLLFKVELSFEILEGCIEDEECAQALQTGRYSLETIKRVLSRLFFLGKVNSNQIKYSLDEISKGKYGVLTVEDNVKFDHRFLQEVLEALKDLKVSFASLKEGSLEIELEKGSFSEIEKFNICFIIYLMKVFHFDTKVKVNGKEIKNYDC